MSFVSSAPRPTRDRPRLSQPPATGPSLSGTPARHALPTPRSLRPSLFRPRSSPHQPPLWWTAPPRATNAGSPALTQVHAQATPAGASRYQRRARKSNPFQEFSGSAFDDFVGSVTDRIKRALEGPPPPPPRSTSKRPRHDEPGSVEEDDVFQSRSPKRDTVMPAAGDDQRGTAPEFSDDINEDATQAIS